MGIFQIFHIKNMVRDARNNPSAFAGKQTQEALTGLLIVPLLIAIAAIILFFIAGYTNLFGFNFWFFKFLFWLALIISTIFYIIVRGIIRSISAFTQKGTKTTLQMLHIDNEAK